jgi:Spy/CpxP family protein refolding chaperone
MNKILLGLVGTLALSSLIALAADQAAPAAGEKGPKAGVGMRWGQRLGLNLTADQKAKIAGIRQNAREQVKAVLTDEQKAKIAAAKEKLQAMRPNLTDDQKAKIKEIFGAAREKAKAAGTPEEKAKIFQAARAEARKLLTDEQIQKIDALKAHLKGWRGRVFRRALFLHSKFATAPAK